jgi:predicted transcriptional regulator
MTYLLQEAFRRVSALPPTEQDRIAQAMLALAAFDEAAQTIPAEDLPAVLEGLAQLDRGEFADEAEVEAVFKRARM